MSRVAVISNQSNGIDCAKIRARRHGRADSRSLPKKFAKCILLALLLPVVLSACAMEGDFGRPRVTVFDRAVDEFLSIETALLDRRGGSGVTDDERAMREAGFRLASPLIASARGGAGPYGGAGPVHPLAALEGQLGGDHQALTQFGIAARRVLVTDSRRMQAAYDRDRMRENFSFIEVTFEDLGRRLKAYYYAIDEARSGAPDAVTIKLEGSLKHLRGRVASLEYELTRYFGAAVARGDYQPPRFASKERRRYRPAIPDRRPERPSAYIYK